MKSQDKLTVRCPHCDTSLVIDVATGQVLHHKAPKKESASHDFDALLSDLDASKERADEIFDRELGSIKDKDRLMEEKFREALKRAEEEGDDGRPVRPWDLD